MTYKLEDLIDVPKIKKLQDKLNVLYSFSSAVIDNEGNVLTAVAWQNICAKFHRINPDCAKECIRSNKYILEHFDEANPSVTYQCPRGLIDNAVPIIIDGRHLGNFFTGQIFLEKPDPEFFRQQANKYGFDEKEYLDAMEKVPVWSEEKLFQHNDFINGFIEIIAGLGLKNLKQIETARILNESELKYTSLFNQIPDGIALHSLIYDTDNVPVDYITLDVNKGFEDIFNIKKEDVVGIKASKILPAAELKKWLDIFALVAMNGTSYKYEIFSDANCKHFEGIAFSTKKDHFATIFRDVTDQKKAAIELNKTKEKAEEMSQRLQLALMSGQFGIWDWNVTDNNMIWDDRMFELYGINRDHSPNTVDQWTNGLHPDDKQRAMDECNAALNGEKDFDTAFRVIHPDGKVLHLKADGLVIRDENNNPVRMLGINRDVSKEEYTRSELIKSKEKAEESHRLKTSFLRNISHEVRTPLNSIVGFSSIIAGKEYADKKLEKYAKIIECNSDKLVGIITDVIEISKIQEAQVEINLTEIKLKALITRAIEPLFEKTKNTKTELFLQTNHIPEETIIISDESKLQRIIFHLADNAVKFTHQGSIDIHAELSGENLRIIISDTGIGMEEQHQQYILKPFRQVETEIHKAYGGLGLGLTIVQAYIELLKGHLSFKSEPFKGTTVTVEIPVLKLINTDENKPTSGQHTSRNTILIAEDDLSSFFFLKEALESEDIAVLHACNGQKAVEMCSSHNEITLVLMDIKMPVMDGITAACEIKKILPQLPIIAQTAYADEIDMQTTDEYFDDYISKPSPLELLRRKISPHIK